MSDLYGRVNKGRTKDSLLKVEQRETDAVLDEDGEVLSFHHDRPVRGRGMELQLSRRGETGGFSQESFFIGAS